ncbi:CocE/NonD family hydrolase [Nocardioides sp. CER19]|uniref:CocE/NonD family hydrolase n=1 Tax=Nocardioides sp. CER19 TaxID=3038538 RepID=UPI00244C178E|nr:CocE/NonD family hydrolase [Nocardioides sp. CER19]MDH2415630.1 CocE/NonD family hydrolase [Nocardioides sp. CER19]
MIALLAPLLAVFLAVPAPPATAAVWSPRPADYPGTVTQRDLAIPMSDGTVLRGDLTLPADADGAAVPGRWPVVVTITAYNKSAQAAGGGLAGSDPTYLVERGYAQLTVDARGTGSSEGTWCAFCTREDTDSGEVVTWAVEQPWSNGSTAMSGPSYMGIDQIFAAASHPKGLKAIFPQVPAADVYRDVVASGGQVDVGFIPLWMGLVTGTGVIPPAVTAGDPRSGLTALAQHLGAIGSFTAPMLLNALGGQDQAYDGDFYAQRSPINVVDEVQVPTFLVSGEYDLFQRGTPLLFERLQQHGVPVRMVTGPWNHLQASAGDGLAEAGHGSLQELQLRWFDHWVKGVPDPRLDDPRDFAPITYYEQGTGAWRTANRWVDPADVRATSLPLAGSAAPGRPGTLGTAPTTAGRSTVLPVPVSGLCSRSSDQWTAGLLSELELLNGACFEDNRVNDTSSTLFETSPLTQTLPVLGPIDARLYVSSNTGDGMLSVGVSDVAPDGSVRRLTGGWQVISMRSLDTDRTRYLDGKVLQPYHPFTQASVSLAKPGQVVPVDVEVFPTGAALQPGHRLRLSVQAFDVPHLAPTLPQLPGVLTALTLHSSAAYPSALVLPTRGRQAGSPR